MSKIRLAEQKIIFEDFEKMKNSFVYLVISEDGIRIQKEPSNILDNYGFILKDEIIYDDLYEVLSLYARLYNGLENKDFVFIESQLSYYIKSDNSETEWKECAKQNIKNFTTEEIFCLYHNKLITRSMGLRALNVNKETFENKYLDWKTQNDML